jgi:hypothetical protein
LPGAIGAFLLVMAFGISLCWPMAFIGITAKTPEAVNTWAFLIILPLTFASSVFVSAVLDARLAPADRESEPDHEGRQRDTRADAGYRTVAKPVLQSIIWMIVIVGIFAPLAVAKYRRRV